MIQPLIPVIKECLRNRRLSKDFYSALRVVMQEVKTTPDLEGLWHPLGFITITLQDWHENERLRLHIWHNKERHANQNKTWIHNHEYDIVSLVLYGEILNRVYERISVQNGRLQIYNVNHKDQNSDLVATGQYCELKLASIEQVKSGQFYSLDRTMFHSSDVDFGDISATLVLNIEKQKLSPQIVGDEGIDQEEYIYKRENCHPQLLAEAIEILMANLESGQI